MISFSSFTSILAPMAEIALKFLKVAMVLAIVGAIMGALGFVTEKYIPYESITFFLAAIKNIFYVVSPILNVDLFFTLISSALYIEMGIWTARGSLWLLKTCGIIEA